MHLRLAILSWMFPLTYCQAEWTQYSDRADLPMSKKARDRIRDKLSGVDPDKLSAEHRVTFDRLSEILNEDHEHKDSVGYELLIVPLLFIIACIAVCYASRSNPVLKEVNMDEAREARLKKFN